ncbi:UDP-3-O-acylglucosamine N-acyltransferase [invertebrate metagenome]|uniref:UDP-3-O-acylglucosamine N-acyltransferase n=1 Tax=invertebrate metagenome TaxID=1711999 RepID=A0A2H9T7D0_9ZZZZ
MKDSIGYTLSTLADITKAELISDSPDYRISGLRPLTDANAEDLSFLSNPSYIRYLEKTQAGCVILKQDHAALFSGHKLIVDDPYLAYAKVSALFDHTVYPCQGVHESAVVSESAIIHETACIGAHVVIEDRVQVGENVSIEAGAVIGHDSIIGDNSRVARNVTICHGVSIGKRSIVHSGAVVGSDGFGNAFDGNAWHKITQIGGVVIGNDVEIGASTCIDRGALGNTVIGDGVRLDNLIQIGHNVEIGNHTAIAAMAGVSGSTQIGKYCIIAGQAGLAGHLKIADQVQVGGMAMVTGSISKSGSYASGTGLMDIRRWRKNAVRFRQLDDIAKRLGALEKQALGKTSNG